MCEICGDLEIFWGFCFVCTYVQNALDVAARNFALFFPTYFLAITTGVIKWQLRLPPHRSYGFWGSTLACSHWWNRVACGIFIRPQCCAIANNGRSVLSKTRRSRLVFFWAWPFLKGNYSRIFDKRQSWPNASPPLAAKSVQMNDTPTKNGLIGPLDYRLILPPTRSTRGEKQED